jgi:hypothetical protein
MSVITLKRLFTKTAPAECPHPWLKRLGIASFLFFLLKGLAWLLLPALWYYFGG